MYAIMLSTDKVYPFVHINLDFNAR